MGICGFTGLWAFWVQFKNTRVREQTFGRNFEVIEEKYGDIHREALGKDTRISKFGYPDMGNNIYSDELPYKDWIRVNNAQRCHENFYNQLPIFYSTVFISALNFPQIAFWSSAAYLALRI